MQAVTRRAKLEFAVRDLERAVAKFTADIPGKDASMLNVRALRKWIRDVTNPKHKSYDRSFVTALAGRITPIQNRLRDLDDIVDVGKSGGLIIQGVFAGGGAAVGSAVGGPVGATVGALAGASGPERMVSALTSERGAALLTQAARFGKGSVNQQVWGALGQVTTREAFGEEDRKSVV